MKRFNLEDCYKSIDKWIEAKHKLLAKGREVRYLGVSIVPTEDIEKVDNEIYDYLRKKFTCTVRLNGKPLPQDGIYFLEQYDPKRIELNFFLTIPFSKNKDAEEFLMELLEEIGQQEKYKAYCFFLSKKNVDPILFNDYDILPENSTPRQYQMVSCQDLIKAKKSDTFYAYWCKDDNPDDLRMNYDRCSVSEIEIDNSRFEIYFDKKSWSATFCSKEATSGDMCGRGSVYIYKALK